MTGLKIGNDLANDSETIGKIAIDVRVNTINARPFCNATVSPTGRVDADNETSANAMNRLQDAFVKSTQTLPSCRRACRSLSC